MSGLMLQPKAQSSRHKMLGSPEIRRMLSDYVRRRVAESDIDDVVQTVLVEALASERVPDERTELRKWLTGVARHKIADLHRRAGREKPSELPDIETAPPPVEEHEMVKWAETEAKKSSKDADATLRWMAREGEGDKLEHIAAEEKLPAATVRQRVSRMRRWMKERWLAELAAAAAVLSILALVLYRFVLAPKSPDVVREEPRPLPSALETAPPKVAPSPVERAAELRLRALPTCQADPSGCLDKLDQAKRLDPAGDSAPAVQEARKQAAEKLQNQPPQQNDGNQKEPSQPPAPSNTATPSSTSLPPPSSTSNNKSVPPKVESPSTGTPQSPKAPPQAKPPPPMKGKSGSVKPSSQVLDDASDSTFKK